MYLVFMIPENDPFGPEFIDGWDAAILGLQLAVKANNVKEAKSIAMTMARARKFFVKIVQVIEVKGA